MRKLLLAGAAIAGVGAMMPIAAFAQAPTVFPETTRAGKLDGAAPGSVSVSIGGTLFSGILFQGGSNNREPGKKSNPNLLNYIRLYPNFDYASPSGIHYGVSAEIRSNGAKQGQGRNGNTLYWHTAFGYVGTPTAGKFEVGSPNDAIDQLGVGTGDDFGTGGFYGEYGWVNNPNFISADSYDGDSPKQKLAYISPEFAGLTLGFSYQPTAVGLNNSSGLQDHAPAGSATGAQSRDRLEVALQFSHAFGPAALKADVGYATAAASNPIGVVGNFKRVSFVDAGLMATIGGIELEGHLDTGRYSYATRDDGAPFGPLIAGAKDTTAYILGVGYRAGPFSVGAQYYGVTYDQGDADGGIIGKTARVSGEAIGAGYQVGPGVSVYLDAMTDEIRSVNRVHGNALGVGTYFSW